MFIDDTQISDVRYKEFEFHYRKVATHQRLIEEAGALLSGAVQILNDTTHWQRPSQEHERLKLDVQQDLSSFRLDGLFESAQAALPDFQSSMAVLGAGDRGADEIRKAQYLAGKVLLGELEAYGVTKWPWTVRTNWREDSPANRLFRLLFEHDVASLPKGLSEILEQYSQAIPDNIPESWNDGSYAAEGSCAYQARQVQFALSELRRQRGTLSLPAYSLRLRRAQHQPAARAKIEAELNKRCIAVNNLRLTVSMHRARLEALVRRGPAECAQAALAAIRTRNEVAEERRRTWSQYGLAKPRANPLYGWYFARNRALFYAGALCRAKSALRAVDAEFTQNKGLYEELTGLVDALVDDELKSEAGAA